jgi:hypothetical protein
LPKSQEALSLMRSRERNNRRSGRRCEVRKREVPDSNNPAVPSRHMERWLFPGASRVAATVEPQPDQRNNPDANFARNRGRTSAMRRGWKTGEVGIRPHGFETRECVRAETGAVARWNGRPGDPRRRKGTRGSGFARDGAARKRRAIVALLDKPKRLARCPQVHRGSPARLDR